MKLEQDKQFYTIGEVADQLHINPSLLRYWEKKFPTIRPVRTFKSIRQYRQREIEEIRLIYYLVKEKGMTLSGARQKLKENREKIVCTQEVVCRLKKVREKLVKLKAEFDELDMMYSQLISKKSEKI